MIVLCIKEISGSYTQSQFWLNVHEIFLQGASMYLLIGNVFFFQWGAQIKSHVALNFSSNPGNICKTTPQLLKIGRYLLYMIHDVNVKK